MPVHSCDPRFYTQDGMTLLMAATKHDKENVATWLLDRNADINSKNEMKPVRQVACCIRRADSVT